MKIIIAAFAIWMLLNAASSFAQPGTLDSTFSKDGKVFTSIGGYNDGANAVAIQKNGKILAAGYSHDSTGKSAFALVRYLTHGKVDSSFGNNGIVTTYFRDKSSVANAVAIQNDGKIIVAGYSKKTKYNSVFSIARYMRDGSPDYSFGLNGKVITDIDSSSDRANAIAIQPDGKIVVAGYTANYNDTRSRSIEMAVVRYRSDGTPDSSFGTAGKVITDFGGWSQYYPHNDDFGNAVAVLPDGKIIVGGYSTPYDGYPGFALVRYKPNGTLDTSFGTKGLISTYSFSYAFSMAILPNAKILLAGCSLSLASFFTVAQYKKDGVPDSSFGQNGKASINYPMYVSNYGKSLAVQQNGKIIVAGFSNSSPQQLELMRFTSRGVLDSSFGTNGIVFSDLQSKFTYDMNNYNNSELAPVVTLQEDGKIVVAGNGQNKFAIVRYNGDPAAETPLSDNMLSKQGFTNISSIYASPNPVKNILHIQKLSSSIKIISIFNLKGKVLRQAATANNSYSFDVKQLPAGMYFVSIKEGEKNRVLKFIKE